MSYKIEFQKGKKVEKEHRGTYARMKAGKIKTANKFYESVAKEHLKEDKNYYSKLKKLSLMIGIFSILTFMILSINMASAGYVLQTTPNATLDLNGTDGGQFWVGELFDAWANGTNIYDGNNETFGVVDFDIPADVTWNAGYNLTYILPDNVDFGASQIYSYSNCENDFLKKANLTSGNNPIMLEGNNITLVVESWSDGGTDNETALYYYQAPEDISPLRDEAGNAVTFGGCSNFEDAAGLYEINIMWAINETAPEEPEETPSITSNTIYKTFEGTGSGVAIFLDNVKIPLALLILLLGIVAVIVYIVFSIKDIIVWKFNIGQENW